MKKPSWNELMQEWLPFVETTPRAEYIEAMAFKVEAKIGKVEWKAAEKALKSLEADSERSIERLQAEAFRDETRAVKALERAVTPKAKAVKAASKQFECEAVVEAIKAKWAAWKPSCFGGTATETLKLEAA